MKKLSLLAVLFVVSVALQASEDRRDGNWWRDQPRTSRLSYVIGFFDGMHLGFNFSYWGFVHQDKQCESKVNQSYNDNVKKYLANVPNDQIVDGLDVFYSDYRNRKIKMADAVWLVANGIAGTPQKQLDEMIENWRKNSSD